MRNKLTLLSLAMTFIGSPLLAQSAPHNGNQTTLTEENTMRKVNESKFAAIRALNLPIDQYAITGSGALGIRNLRAIGDIDIIVTPELWNILEKKYGIIDENNIRKIAFPDGIVEAFGEQSFYTETKESDAPTINERIVNADVIDGLPFESLEHVLYYKRKMNREKDRQDIEKIENFIRISSKSRALN